MKSLVLISTALLLTIIMASCKKSNSSTSSSYQSLLIGKWTIVNDSSIVIYNKNNGYVNSYSNAINTSGILFEQFLPNNIFVFNAYDGSTYVNDSTITWHFIDSNKFTTFDTVVNIVGSRLATCTITYLDAHNLSYTAIHYGNSGYDSLDIDYINDKR